MSGFTKLWSDITDSSIWNESDKTRIVWITMLARMGPDYVVRASVGGLAHLARVTREDCVKSLKVLSDPDPDSRTSDFEGRRIEKIEGGFFIINGKKWREQQTAESRRAYMRDYMKKYRAKDKDVNNVKNVKNELAVLGQAEAEVEAEEEVTISNQREDRSAELPTWDEVWDLAKMRGILRETAESFFNWHNDNNYWLNKYGALINWKSKLQNWKTRSQTIQTKGNAPKRKRASADELLRRLNND